MAILSSVFHHLSGDIRNTYVETFIGRQSHLCGRLCMLLLESEPVFACSKIHPFVRCVHHLVHIRHSWSMRPVQSNFRGGDASSKVGLRSIDNTVRSGSVHTLRVVQLFSRSRLTIHSLEPVFFCCAAEFCGDR